MNRAMGFDQGPYLLAAFLCERVLNETDGVQSANAIISPGHGIRRQILAHSRPTLHQRQSADAHKLMNQAIAGNEGPICDLRVAGQKRAARQNHVITQYDIVTHMAMLHQKIMRANYGVLHGNRRAMNGHVLPKYVMVADLQSARLSLIF